MFNINFQITDTKIYKRVKTRNSNTATIDEENYFSSNGSGEYEDLQKNMLRFVTPLKKLLQYIYLTYPNISIGTLYIKRIHKNKCFFQ